MCLAKHPKLGLLCGAWAWCDPHETPVVPRTQRMHAARARGHRPVSVFSARGRTQQCQTVTAFTNAARGPVVVVGLQQLFEARDGGHGTNIFKRHGRGPQDAHDVAPAPVIGTFKRTTFDGAENTQGIIRFPVFFGSSHRFGPRGLLCLAQVAKPLVVGHVRDAITRFVHRDIAPLAENDWVHLQRFAVKANATHRVLILLVHATPRTRQINLGRWRR